MGDRPTHYQVLPRWNLIIVAVPAVGVVAVLGFALYVAAIGHFEFFARYGLYLVVALAAMLLALRPLVALSHSVEIRSDAVHFMGLWGEKIVRSGRAQSLRPARGISGAFELCFEGGRATFFSRFTGFHEVVRELKEQNPSMTIEKC